MIVNLENTVAQGSFSTQEFFQSLLSPFSILKRNPSFNMWMSHI